MFFVSRNPAASFPEIMVSACAVESKNFYLPVTVIHPAMLAGMRISKVQDSTLVVAGAYLPSQVSHAIMNFLIPLEHTVASLGLADRGDVHLLAVTQASSQASAFPFSLTSLGFASLMGAAIDHEVGTLGTLTNLQTGRDLLRPGRAVCYAKAIVGLNFTCANCPTTPSEEAYTTLRRKASAELGFSVARPDPLSALLIRRTARRKIANEDAVENLLVSLGFRVSLVAIEELSLKTQAREFAQAAVVLAPHGRENVNVHWMFPGSHLIEVFNWSAFGDGLVEAAAAQAGVLYHKLYCESTECMALNTGDEKGDETAANLAELEEVLRDIRVKTG